MFCKIVVAIVALQIIGVWIATTGQMRGGKRLMPVIKS